MGIGCHEQAVISVAKHRRAVFLDRDGVLIEAIVRDNKPYAVTSPDEVQFTRGAAEACAELKRCGFLLVLVTNQPDVARGKISRQFVDDVNDHVVATLGLDLARVCDHDNHHNCNCRKPKPGLITDAAKEFSIELSTSYMVGDRWRDIEAGQNAGCRTVFVDYGYAEDLPSAPDHTAHSLAEAVPFICNGMLADSYKM
jgi:D-glycero-D-manno-heptose 1,7-bisphosphate phosphatase